MRVVMLGKGGSGKSSLGGLLCAALSGSGEQVLAIDADTVPGLAQVLGLEPSDDWFLAGAAARRNGGWELDGTPEEVVERYARAGANGVRFLQMGKADAGFQQFEANRQGNPGRWSAMVAFNTIIRSYDDQGGWVVVDLQGGTLQVAAGMAGRAGVALVVVEPFAKSVLTARRFVEMGEWPEGMRLVGVANKVADAEDEAYLTAELAALDLPVWAVVPEDPAIGAAERAGRPLAVLTPEQSPARRAVDGLVDRLRDADQAATTTAATA
ncbi:MAG: cellulose synthase operon protein YhjQ/BcsQ [Egibacteraceae bacterium]